MKRFWSVFFALTLACVLSNAFKTCQAAEGSRYAHSDSNARYLHHIDLYDGNNRKITADSSVPYSSLKTCGRCHDYETISHGWHFNAFDPDSAAGRAGEPWIWTDARTGTQLPLSYRDWKGVFNPNDLGITSFEMTEKFGGRIPGGLLSAAPAKPKTSATSDSDSDATSDNVQTESDSAEDSFDPVQSPRWKFAGSLEIDCMVCHAVSGAYDFNARRSQVELQNFAWAPTAGLRLGKIDGKISSIKDDADAVDESTQKRIPKVTYDAARFNADGTVFMDLVRHPPSNSCYQCHSYRTVTENGLEPRWMHDEDVHLRAGMQCSDCHRNGIDHHIVRGFDGEKHPSGQNVETLSCAGCHLGSDTKASEKAPDDMLLRAGRLGSPKPLHAGLPPLHFEKLTCTACHGGPAPRDKALGVMTSFAHGLGTKEHRSGQEMPLLASPIYKPNESGLVAPHRAMWPSFWAELKDGKANPISPNKVYDITRRSLRVRNNFVDELLKPKVSSKVVKELLGEERAAVPAEERTAEEQAKIDEVQRTEGLAEFNEKIYKALAAIEKELEIDQAAYVSTGFVYVRGEEEETVKKIELDDSSTLEMVSWPTAHNVRPAGWSLGVTGCTECHQEGGKIFASTVSPMGPGPDKADAISMATLQGVDPNQRLAWNELFKGRKDFKVIVGSAIAVLTAILLIGIGAVCGRWAGNIRVTTESKA